MRETRRKIKYKYCSTIYLLSTLIPQISSTIYQVNCDKDSLYRGTEQSIVE